MNKAVAIRPEGKFGPEDLLNSWLCYGSVVGFTVCWIAGAVMLANSQTAQQALKGKVMLGVGLPLSVASAIGCNKVLTGSWCGNT